MIRIEIELSVTGPNKVLNIARQVADALTSHGGVDHAMVHRITVEEADA